MSEKKVGKRLLTWVLVLVMTLSLLPLNVLADEVSGESNVVYGHYDGAGWVKDETGTGTDPITNVEGVDSVSKTAKRVGDNTYEVTLQVQMHTTTETQTSYAQAATVLVIDTSGSMACPKKEHTHDWSCDLFGCSEEEHTHSPACDCRLKDAKAAAIDFLDSYKAGGTGRYVALVRFSTDAEVAAAGWQDVSTDAGYNAILASINNLSANGGTNLEQGLAKAQDLLGNSTIGSIASKNIIALTDGKPTYYNEPYDHSRLGIFPDIRPDGDGGDCDKETFKATQGKAEEILNMGYSLYSICFGAANEEVKNPYTNKKISLFEYLNSYIAPGKTYSADDFDGLKDAFDAISKEITTGLSSGTVHDSLPTGVTSDAILNRTVEWDLNTFDKETSTNGPEGNTTTTYTYTKRYTVTIDPTQIQGIEDGDYYPLNGPTTLTVGDGVVIDFPIPAGKVTLPKYTLTYNANGGSGAPAAVSDNKAGDTVDLDYSNQPTHAQQDGKNVIFIGWTTTDTNEKVYTNGESLPDRTMQATFVNSNITVYAVWGLDENGNGVPDALEAKVTYKVENGYWYDAATGKAAGSEIVCLRPLYEKSDNGVWKSCNATLGDSIPTGRAGNEGYTADGWYKNDETTKMTIDATTPVTGDVTYTFKYVPETKPDTYTVVLHLDGGTYTTAPEYTPTADGYQYCLSKATDKVNPTITTLNKNGYEFKGWSLSETAPQALIGADETFASLSVQQNVLNGNHGKIDLYAVWQEIKYTLTYDANGGTSAPTAVNNKKAGDTVDLDYSNQPTHAQQDGKNVIFIGWTTTDTNEKVYTNGESLPKLMMQATFVNSNITVYAVWGLDDNGNGVPDALEAKVTYKVEKGYWYDAATGQATGSEIVCLRPLYKKSDNGVWKSCNATLGDSIPTGRAGNEGYTADGWYKNDETKKITIDAATPVTGNVTYTFKYVPEIKPDTYTVVLHLDGGTYTTAPEYTKTTDGYQYCLRKATDKVNPTITTLNKNGYEFKGWSLSGTAPQALIGADETFASLSVQQNGLNGNHGKIDLYAVWQEIKYTVTYNLDGGTTTSKETTFSDLIHGIKTPTIKEPSKAGYTFAGWEPKVAETVTKDVTYKAKWNAIYVPYYPPVPPTVKIEDDDALGLNTTDHFAYIVGYGNGEVRPQNNITRAEVATIFFRLLTDDVRDENLTKTNRYSDVTRADWYNTAVSTLSSMGIITGYPDGTFRPNAAITRAEFAAIAARFDNDGDKTTAKFSDIATHWARDEISIAYNNGWINGYPDGTFGPQRDITRAETMTLVNRVLNRQPETEDDLLPNMTVWTDNASPKAWYYLAVQEATNSHYYKFKTNSKYEKWSELRETRDWTLLEK